MSTKPPEWVEGPWSVQLHSVNRSPYVKLHMENRSFPNWIISYVKTGHVTTGTGGETHTAKAGDVMLHPPGLPFSEHADVGGVHLWMQVSILCSHQFDLLMLYRVSPVITLPEPARYEAVFAKLLAEWGNRELSFRDLKITTSMLQLTEMILTGWEKAGNPERSSAYSSSGDRFARLIGQMSMRLEERLTREELASLVCLSANYMDRAFQQQFGLTPMQMLRDMRLKRAKQLLEMSEETLETIAARCGFTDASYLCKQFKKEYGVLPGEYRESVRYKQTENVYG
ncbi:AraC family transcriptional regulator [Paenibacillus chondroitinus]|uniref:AraC family transcriptional regulator n=1 Tax=Paenibacillus chondroitinus TaxID=59842 RepID=A0ABU6D8B0_9BACL|nr:MULTISPECIES: AraC family transcriptional regulator [Paenibacillus]MCY9659846.1 AraC family transcriptional regulator [Paenibacillus anseongense]MEB4793975.1 AraC family transcriptional regulator [Paenibacillus chondroitinus]